MLTKWTNTNEESEERIYEYSCVWNPCFCRYISEKRGDANLQSKMAKAQSVPFKIFTTYIMRVFLKVRTELVLKPPKRHCWVRGSEISSNCIDQKFLFKRAKKFTCFNLQGMVASPLGADLGVPFYIYILQFSDIEQFYL